MILQLKWIFIVIIYEDFTAQVLKVCRTPGPTPTACLKLLMLITLT